MKEIYTKKMCKIDMKQMSFLGDHNVIIMSVT